MSGKDLQVLSGATDNDKLDDLCTRTYKEQAVWFLNAFWEELEPHAEQMWAYVSKCNDLDAEHHELGTGLDELNAHRLLEAFDETLTVRAMRTELRSTKALGEKDRPKTVPLAHYLLCRFKNETDWNKLVHAAQGDNKEEIEEAQRRLEKVQADFKASEARASEARQALIEAQSREAEAKRREEEALAAEAEAKAAEAAALEAEANAKAREAEARAAESEAKAREAEALAAEEQAKSREAEAHASAEVAKQTETAAKASAAAAVDTESAAKAAAAELAAALAEVQKQEDAYNARTKELERKSEEGGVVSRNRAKNELAQHLAEDPLPLRRAKITAEAASKRADKTAAAAAAARAQADADAEAATKARHEAEIGRAHV